MTARQCAARALDRVLHEGGFSNLVLRSALEALPAAERPFATTLFYGVLERQYTLEKLLRPCLTQPPSRLDRLVRVVLLMGLYQLYYMDSVPDHAAVNESVALCRQLGRARQSGFVNGVLRSILRGGKAMPQFSDPVEALSFEGSCPPKLTKHYIDAYGVDAARRILQAGLERPPVCLRVNTTRVSCDELLRQMAAAGVSAAALPGLPDTITVQGAVERLPGYAEGLFHAQDPAAQLAALLLEARPGETVVDVCAAPGGKSFTVAECMGDRGAVHAFDLAPQRAKLIADGAKRLGLASVHAAARDGLDPDPSLFGKADRLLCDLPCSGLGVIRRKPELKNRAEWEALPELQMQLLEQSIRYLKPGGVLVYATCTLNPEENERLCERFAERHPEFMPMPFDLPEPFAGAAIREMRHTATLLPGLCDGFFMARWGLRPHTPGRENLS